MSATGCHPSKIVDLLIGKLDKRFEQLRLQGLKFWTRPLRDCQRQQDAVSAEAIREIRELQTLFEHVISDGVVTDEERDRMISRMRELELELTEGRVIPGSGDEFHKLEGAASA